MVITNAMFGLSVVFCPYANSYIFGALVFAYLDTFILWYIQSKENLRQDKECAELYAKDLESFARDIPVAAQIYRGYAPPRCIQEAACLCAIMGNTKPVQSIAVDRTLAKNVQKGVKEIQKAGKKGKDKMQKYEGSYLYYYFYKETDTKNYKGGDLKK